MGKKDTLIETMMSQHPPRTLDVTDHDEAFLINGNKVLSTTLSWGRGRLRDDDLGLPAGGGP